MKALSVIALVLFVSANSFAADAPAANTAPAAAPATQQAAPVAKKDAATAPVAKKAKKHKKAKAN